MTDEMAIDIAKLAASMIAKSTARRYPAMTHDQLVALLDVLWTEPVHERRLACVESLSPG